MSAPLTPDQAVEEAIAALGNRGWDDLSETAVAILAGALLVAQEIRAQPREKPKSATPHRM